MCCGARPRPSSRGCVWSFRSLGTMCLVSVVLSGVDGVESVGRRLLTGVARVLDEKLKRDNRERMQPQAGSGRK